MSPISKDRTHVDYFKLLSYVYCMLQRMKRLWLKEIENLEKSRSLVLISYYRSLIVIVLNVNAMHNDSRVCVVHVSLLRLVLVFNCFPVSITW